MGAHWSATREREAEAFAWVHSAAVPPASDRAPGGGLSAQCRDPTSQRQRAKRFINERAHRSATD